MKRVKVWTGDQALGTVPNGSFGKFARTCQRKTPRPYRVLKLAAVVRKVKSRLSPSSSSMWKS